MKQVRKRKINVIYIYIYTHIHTHTQIYRESRKMVLMKLFSGQQWRHIHREQTYEYGKQGEGEGEMYGESNMETYITIYKIYSQCEFAV